MMNIGDRLRRLRMQRNLTQEEMADRCELSKGFISQVERDLASPSIATLTDMLECLGSDLKTFFSAADEDEKIVFEPADMFEKTDEENLRGSILWLVPSAQKNEMEPILVNIGPGGKMNDEDTMKTSVLSGSIVLKIGDKKHRVKTGGSFCIHPTAPHCLINTGKRSAKVLWVSTPPSF